MIIQKFLLLIVFMVGSISSFATPRFSDSDAKNLINGSLNPSHRVIKLGPLSVVSRDKIGQNDVSTEAYKFYKALEKVGLISISVDPKYKGYKSGATFNWKDFQTQTGGVNEKIIVKKTDKGTKYSKSRNLPYSDREFAFNEGVYKTQEIIKNDPLTNGIDDYRLINLTYTAEWTPEYREVVQLLGEKLSNEFKGSFLLKFDPFDKVWKVEAVDMGIRGKDFVNESVPKAINAFSLRAK